MKQTFLLFTLLLLAFQLNAQNSNSIIGTWLTQDGDSKVVIDKNKDGTFDGKIVWLKDPYRENGEEKKDDKNPDDQLKNRPILGLTILEGFMFDNDDQEWVDGTIYDPKNGNTYKCLMWFDDDNPDELIVKGYIGFSLIGRKVEWTRVL